MMMLMIVNKVPPTMDRQALREKVETRYQAEVAAMLPGVAGIGVFSPPLDAKGNSVRGIKVFEELSERFGLHAFESQWDGESFLDQLQPPRRG